MATKKSKDKSGMSLMDSFSSLIEEEDLGGYNEYQPVYSTGMDIIDYRNGQFDINGNLSLGINGGKILSIIGKSGSAKTSLAIKIACSIVEPYDEGTVIHFDYEHATKIQRVKALSGWDNETLKAKYKILDKNIYSESLYQFIKASAKLKTEKFDEIKIDTGEVNEKGETVYGFPPTVLIVDSWALVIPKDYSEEEKLSGSMSASATAKINNQIIKRTSQAMGDCNITLIVVNHITTKIDIGMMPTPAILNYLKQDEAVPGGSSIIFMADSLIKLQASTKLTPDKEFGIKGFMVTGLFVKSRSNDSGIPFELVFEQSRGFNNILTNFNTLKKLKLLKGNGRAYYFDFAPDVKFTQRTFEETYKSNEDFAEKFDEYLSEVYLDYISNSYINDESEEEDTSKKKKSKKKNNKADEIESLDSFSEWYDKDELIWVDTDGNVLDEDGDEVEVEEE